MAGLAGGVPGLIVGAVAHSLIDATGKFGLQDWRGPLIDQLSHLLLILLVYLYH